MRANAQDTHKKLILDTPCTQNYDNMLPHKQGKFCQSCECKVVDFSGWDKDEIKAYFAAPENQGTCGKFDRTAVDKVNYRNYIKKYFEQGFSLKRIAYLPIAVFLGFTFLFNSAFCGCMSYKHMPPAYGNATDSFNEPITPSDSIPNTDDKGQGNRK